MITTSEMLKAWSVLQPNRCKFIPELGPNCFAIYMDGNHHILHPRNMDPSLSGVEQCFLVRSVQQAISSSGEYSLEIKTIRKHKFLFQSWVSHDSVDVVGFAEEDDLSDSLLRAYIQVLEKLQISWEQEAIKNPMFSISSPVSTREY